MPSSKVARIISLNSQKGGVGKTTSAIHLSKGLALGGYRTVSYTHLTLPTSDLV